MFLDGMPRRISATLLDLPDKHFFTVGEVSHLTWVKPYALRYWETRFKPLRPARLESGQRKYTRRDIEIIRRIRKLLYDQKLTIEGAKKQLNQELKGRVVGGSDDPADPQESAASLLKEIKQDILEMTRELEQAYNNR